jgi:hypothetical protein
MVPRITAFLLVLALFAGPSRAAEPGSVPDSWITAQTAHFTFRYHPKAKSRVAPIIDSAEKDLTRIMNTLGLETVDSIEVRFARNVHEMSNVKPGKEPPPWATGLALRTERLVLVTLTSTDDAHPTDASKIFLHEVVHIAEWDASGGNPTPIWFSEGLAIYLAGEYSFERNKVLINAAIRNRLLPLSSLSDSYPGDGRKVNVAYAQSADLVSFLEEKYGPGYLSSILWRVRHGDDFNSAMESLAGASLRQIQVDWMSSLDVWYRWIPSITGGATLWVLIACLLLVGYMRRRRQTRRLYAAWEQEEASRQRQMEEILWEHWDPNTMPKPSDDKSRVEHEGSTHTLH